MFTLQGRAPPHTITEVNTNSMKSGLRGIKAGLFNGVKKKWVVQSLDPRAVENIHPQNSGDAGASFETMVSQSSSLGFHKSGIAVGSAGLRGGIWFPSFSIASAFLGGAVVLMISHGTPRQLAGEAWEFDGGALSYQISHCPEPGRA